jgi:hypothetical protein
MESSDYSLLSSLQYERSVVNASIRSTSKDPNLLWVLNSQKTNSYKGVKEMKTKRSWQGASKLVKPARMLTSLIVVALLLFACAVVQPLCRPRRPPSRRKPQ